MSWEVLLRPRAEADLEEARDWYEARQVGLGRAFIDEAAAAMDNLQQAPDRHPEYYRDIRRAFLVRFPYKILYLIEGSSVIVLRVLHARQDHVRRIKLVR